MEIFAPSDRVDAINTDFYAPICGAKSMPDAYCFPDGPLRDNTVYHVESIRSSRNGNQGLFITRLRAFVGKHHIPWSSSRFRKVDSHTEHAANKPRRKELSNKKTKKPKTGVG